MATAVMELYPGVKISIGPPIENGFYYDFEFPEGVKVTDEDLARIEERMREHIAADEPFVRTDLDPASAERALCRRAAGLQGRADPRPGRGRGGEDRVAVPERPVHGPVPGPACALHGAGEGVQAALAGGRLLARRRAQQDADPHLRDGVPLEEGPRPASRDAGAGPRAGPPPAGTRAGAVHAARGVTRACRSTFPTA